MRRRWRFNLQGRGNVDSATLNTISLCSGVGMLDEGLHAGLEFLGIRSRTVMFAEREAFPVSVLAARMEEGSLAPAPIWFGDFTELPARRFRGLVDGVVAGFPCQDLSVAGRRAGLDGKRSGLFFNVLDIADDCGAWFLFLENVAGIASATAAVVDEASTSDYAAKSTGDGFSDVGIEDGRLLERAAARVMGELADRGWNAEWITLSASDVGASHGRARWFCFAWRLADARLQHGDLQQRGARIEHPRGSEQLDDAARNGRDGFDREAGRGRGVCQASDALDDATGDGRLKWRAEPARQQGRLDVAEHDGAVADPKGERVGPGRLSFGNESQQSRATGDSAYLADAGSARLPQRTRGGVKTMDHFNRPAGPSLPAFIAHSPFSPQGQPTQDGLDCSPDSPGSPQQSQTKRLNPYFVEWLMGWPAGWTSPIARPDCAPEEMVLFRRKLAWQLSYCLGELDSFKDRYEDM